MRVQRVEHTEFDMKISQMTNTISVRCFCVAFKPRIDDHIHPAIGRVLIWKKKKEKEPAYMRNERVRASLSLQTHARTHTRAQHQEVFASILMHMIE